jgi:hypothetical protein
MSALSHGRQAGSEESSIVVEYTPPVVTITIPRGQGP